MSALLLFIKPLESCFANDGCLIALRRWQDTISILVHELISSRLGVRDDASNRDTELRRKADAKRHAVIDVIIHEMSVWLSLPSLNGVDHGCTHPVSKDQVRCKSSLDMNEISERATQVCLAPLQSWAVKCDMRRSQQRLSLSLLPAGCCNAQGRCRTLGGWRSAVRL